jgi:cell wall assembly regulator SMI1
MSEIEHHQDVFGVPFASDLIELCRFGNGMVQGSLIYRTPELLTLAEAVAEGQSYWQHIAQLQLNDAVDWWTTCIPGVKRESWRSYWLPIAHNSGDYIVVDHEPVEGGIHGQVLDYDHEMAGVTCVIAPGLRGFFETILQELRDGKHYWREEEQGLEPVAWSDPNCKYFITWPGGRHAPPPPDWIEEHGEGAWPTS